MATSLSAGLQAVARVRSIREQDSRFGLQQALAEAEARRGRVTELDDRLGAVAVSQESDTKEFLLARASMLALGSALTGARHILTTSETLAVTALGHWQHHKSRLAAIELLQDHRMVESRAEDKRKEAQELDEIAGQLWRRDRTGAGR